MRVAIPIYGTNVSPRFDYAPEAMIVDIEDGREVGRSRIVLEGLHSEIRLNKLKDEDVNVMICGNIDAFSEQMAESMGIRLIPWVMGGLDEAIKLFLIGELTPGTILGPTGPSGRWGLGRNRGQCRRGKWFEEFSRLQEDRTMPKKDGTGPAGKGAGTGRGLGPCGDGAGRNAGSGRGMGRRPGVGRGRGQGGGGNRGRSGKGSSG